MANKPSKPKGGKAPITSKQRTARHKNIIIARAVKHRGAKKSSKVVSKSTYDKRVRKMTKGNQSPGASSKSKAGGAAKSAYKKTYKEVRKHGGSKENARTMALQSAHKKGARWTYKKARTLAVGIGRKYGWSKSGVDQFARGFTKALRRS